MSAGSGPAPTALGRARPPSFVRAGVATATALLAASTALLIGLNGVLAVVTARALGPSGRGQLVLLVTTVALVSLVAALGTNTAMRHHLYSADHPVEMQAYVGLSLLLSALAVPTSAGIAALVFAAADVSLSTAGLLLAGAYGAIFLLALQASDALNAHGWTTLSMMLAAAGVAVQLGVVVVLVLTGVTALEPYFAALATGAAANLALAIATLLHRGVPLRPSAPRAAWALLLRTGIPAVGLNVGQSMVFRLDRFLIGVWLGSAPVGFYSVAATTSETMRLVPASFGQVAFFRVAAHHMDLQELAHARRRLLLLMVAPLALLEVFAPAIVRFVFGDAFEAAVTPLRILLLGELAIMSFQIDARVLSAQGRTRASGAVGLGGLALVAALDVALIPTHGLVGAAWASVVAYLAMGVAARAAVNRYNSGGRPRAR